MPSDDGPFGAGRRGLPSAGNPSASDAPVPVTFPRDDGPHDVNVEWWYFTGHLFTEEGDRYGFEYVTFRARDGNLEGYVSHFAITDNPRRQFHYGQRLRGAAGVAGDAAVLDLNLDGWTMRGGDGEFALAADMPGYAMRLDVETTKPAALHDGDGYIDYGNGTASYYYSWTRMAVTGELDLGQGWRQVSGEAWMDHQWGDFDDLPGGRVGLVLGPARGRDGRDALPDSRCRWRTSSRRWLDRESRWGALRARRGRFRDCCRRGVDESGRRGRHTRRDGRSPFRTTTWR